jgi:hypothetical protein
LRGKGKGEGEIVKPIGVNVEGESVYLGKPPTSQQQALINAGEKEQLYGGAKRGGKTVGGAIKAILLSTVFPGNKGYILRQDLTDLKESTLETFLRICPPELILDHNHTEKRIMIKTAGVPSKIIYSGLSDQTEEESSKGKEAGWIWIDEPSETKQNTYLMYLSQLCWELPPCGCPAMGRDKRCSIHHRNGDFPPFMAILTTNPEAGWVEDRFQPLIERASDTCKVVSNGKQVFIRSLPRDNPYLPPGWEESLRDGSTPEIWVKKYLDGEWGSVEGQVFKSIDDKYHFIHEKDIPNDFLSHLSLIGCLDHASTGVTCFVVVGIDPDANMFILGSYYSTDEGKERRISEHSNSIHRLCDYWAMKCKHMDGNYPGKNLGQWPCLDYFDYVLIDPSTQSKTQMQNNLLCSIQDIYWREGLPTLAAHNAIDPGVDMLQEYFHIKPTHIHPITNNRPSPSIFIIPENNRSGIKELRGWKKVKNDKNEVKYVGADHWIDDVRYIAMSRPEPPRFTRKDLLAMDTHAQKAVKAMASFDKKFANESSTTQWFAGGGGNSRTWFPERMN